MGGQVTPATQSFGPYPCSVRANEKSWSIRLPALTDVETTDRISVNGVTLEVNAVLDRGGQELSRVVLCTKVG